MAKLKLQPDPTFRAKVKISRAGDADDPVEFIFKHRTRAELRAFIDASGNRDDATSILEMATGWELSDPFTRESIQLLVDNYISAPATIFETYIEELTKARAKN